MDTKSMGAYKDRLYEILKELYPEVLKEYKFEWLTNHSHVGVCDDVYANIKSYKGVDFLPKKKSPLPCDYVFPNMKIVLEYDEIQHFTYQRLLSLEAYPPNLALNYDIGMWINLCKTLNRKMNKIIDPYRDEKRALYDSLRDIMMPKHGYKLIRIYHGQIDFANENAKDKIKTIINV